MAAAAPATAPLPELSPAQIRQARGPEDQQCDGAGENRRRDNPVSEEELLWLWLCSCPGLYRNAVTALLHYFGSVKEIFQAPVSALAPWKKTGLKSSLQWVSSLAAHKESGSPERMAELLRRKEISFVSCRHPDFPPSLRDLPDCPYGLFYRGHLPDPGRASVAVIGARCCSNYGYQMAGLISRMLTEQGCQIISGMAVGIDGAAQSACLQNGGSSYAVLGCGADICYPPEHIRLFRSLPEHGGVLSEFAPGTPPLRNNFPIRNRLISGLSDAVVVVEAREKSGSLITADLALEQGKDVYAVPANAMWVQLVLILLLIWIRSLDQLTNLIVFTGQLTNVLIIASVLILRKKMPDLPRPYKVWGGAVTVIIAVLVNIALMYNTFMEDRTSAIMGLGVWVIGAIVYFIFDKKNKNEAK